jgi:sulfur-oxidizing protein SoxY
MSARVGASLSRRGVLAGAGGLAIVGITLTPTDGRATPALVAEQVKKLTGGAEVKTGRVILKMPQIAENGNTVPLTVSVDSPMSAADYVKAVHVWADGNPAPDVASFAFSPLSGKVEVQTRMRMARTQNVVAVAQMSDGSFFSSQAEVKVTIGGCGG